MATGEVSRAREGTIAISQHSIVGQFVYRVEEDRWWWSDDLYRIFGFTRGEVVPTTQLLAAHKHPDDVDRVGELFAQVLATGGPYSCCCRIIDATQRLHYVVVLGQAARATDETVTELRGFLVDISEVHRQDAAAEADEAVRRATEHRAAIEQAKGALMFVYGLDDDTAFAVLAAVSQHRNIKVNRLARCLMSATEANPPFPVASRRLDDLLRCHPGRPRSVRGTYA